MNNTSESILLRIPELSKSHVKVSNPSKVGDKIRRMVEGGKDTLQTVFDFDHTISKSRVDDKPVAGTVEIFTHLPGVPDNFRTDGGKLIYSHAKVISNPNLRKEDKVEKLDEILQKLNNLIKNIPAPDDKTVEEAVHKCRIELREGVDSTFKTLKDNSVPITIISGGLTYFIQVILKSKNMNHDNVNIIANEFMFKDGKIDGFKDEPITVETKSERFLSNPICRKDLPKRQNIILVGDIVSDANMVDGVPPTANVLKIGYYNGQVHDQPEEIFEKVYDIVIKKDETMKVLNSIIEYILFSKLYTHF